MSALSMLASNVTSRCPPCVMSTYPAQLEYVNIRS
jgi:hypothetical protein